MNTENNQVEETNMETNTTTEGMETTMKTETKTKTPAKAKRGETKEKPKGKGRPLNPAWKAVNVSHFRMMTDKQIQVKLKDAGFETSLVNIYLRRKRLEAQGKNVICPRSKTRPRKSE